MNLEYDEEELELLTRSGEVFELIAPIPARATTKRPDPWAGLVSGGWESLGAELVNGSLPLSLAVDLFRRAGRQLLLEDLLTSAFVLSKLIAAIDDPDRRAAATARLRTRRGLLVGNGRQRFLPVVAEGESHGYAFGSGDDCDVYRLVGQPPALMLQRWGGTPPGMSALGGLSPSITVFAVESAAGPWEGDRLDCDTRALAAIEREALLLHSSGLVGCGQRLLELTRDYAIDRVQFGVQIGSFQAVKHLLADVHTALAVAWNAILSAAAEDGDTRLAPLVARLLTVDAAMACARAGAQVYAGIGFTAELNVHLLLKAILDGVSRGGSCDDIAVELGRRFSEDAC